MQLYRSGTYNSSTSNIINKNRNLKNTTTVANNKFFKKRKKGEEKKGMKMPKKLHMIVKIRFKIIKMMLKEILYIVN